MFSVRLLNSATTMIRAIVLACAAVVPSLPATAATMQPLSSTGPGADTVTVHINPDNVIRTALPDTFFGFNVRWSQFEKDLWDEQTRATKPVVVDALKPLAHAMYRYPGGLVANEFLWEDAAQPLGDRIKLNATRRPQDDLPLLGVDEFAAFLNKVDGRLFYTLNLVGKGNPSNIVEYPAEQMAESNRNLAEKIRSLLPTQKPRYYELGNELDRNKYEWPADKYVSRSLASIKAIQAVDPDARFVAFLRDFNWHYKNGNKGISRYQDLIRDVLSGLPMINDYSLHMYYDGELRPGGNFLDIGSVVKHIDDTLEVARTQRPGKDLGVWITEHSRRILVNNKNAEYAKDLTSGLGGALSSADFLIAMAQIPEVRGTAIQALNGVGRQIFDIDDHGNPKPLPIYWSLRLLSDRHEGKVLDTSTSGPSKSGYPGGYDVRATALTADKNSLNVWLINRASTTTTVEIDYPPFSNRKVSVTHRYMAGKENVPADDKSNVDPTIVLDEPATTSQFDAAGKARIVLPPSSVSTFTFKLVTG